MTITDETAPSTDDAQNGDSPAMPGAHRTLEDRAADAARVPPPPARPAEFVASEWAGETGKKQADVIAIAQSMRTILRPMSPPNRARALDAAKAVLLDPQALALVVAIRELGAGSREDFEAAVALVEHALR